jgi:hypothetical protein
VIRERVPHEGKTGIIVEEFSILCILCFTIDQVCYLDFTESVSSEHYLNVVFMTRRLLSLI